MKRIFLLLLIFSALQINAQKKISDFKQIEKGIYGIWLDQYENKTLLAEFDKFLVVIEFPHNDTVVKEIIAIAKETFPKKPIRYVMHSHHHSHSVSAFDPFLQLTDAKLVTTQYNFSEIKKLTKDSSALKNRVIVYNDSYTIKDKGNEVRILEIFQEKYPVPTKEYNVFYFPAQQVMISGCLFNKPLSYYEVVNSRKPALKKFITDNKLEIKTFVPTNTSKAGGFSDICTREQLDTAIEKGIKPNEFCDQLQSKSIEYLESKRDSLVNEYKKIPRSFDYLVCGNTLKSIRKDYNRAIIVFKAMTRIYPKEGDAYFFIGECYELKGDSTEAIAFYTKAMELAKSEEDKAGLKETIEKLKKEI